MSPRKTAPELFNKFADVYEERFMDVSRYKEFVDRFYESLPSQHVSILELGCGPGNITRYLMEKRPDLKVLATDAAPRMIELAQKNNPNADCRVMDCREIEQLHDKYSGMLCGFVFPYLSMEEVDKFLGDAGQILHTGGILYISTTEGNYSESEWKGPSDGGDDQIFIHYYSSENIRELLEKNGFRIIEMKSQEYIHPDGSKLMDLLVLASKH